MKVTMISALITTVFALGLFSGWLYWQQPGMIFYPVKAMSETPRAWGLEYEDVFIHTEDGIKLHGWYIPMPGAKHTVLFFHGNAGNISQRGDSIEIFHRLGLNVFIFDYRGYGQSEGRPGEKGLYADARAAWRYLIQDKGIAPGNVILFGRSLGGAVATHLAAEAGPGTLILESTFNSVRGMAQEVFPIMSYLVPLRYAFDTEVTIKQVRVPLLVIHSTEDEIIPYKLGRRVYEAANQPKVFMKITGGHNDGFLRSQPHYEKAMMGFLQTYMGTKIKD
jgi:fermentation-respiration switch protein FrsA (DUF1100 family)